MNYWFTTHWPPREDEPQNKLPSGVWIPDGKLDVANEMDAGDLVFVYQSESGPTRMIKYADGTKNIKSRRGRQGIVALCKITSKPYQPDYAKPEHYTDGTTKWWRYCAPVKSINSTGFIPRRRAAQLLGHSEDYLFRGYGTDHSGVKQIDNQIFDALLTEFADAAEAEEQQTAENIHGSIFGGGGEGPIHRALKKRIADDPVGILNEPDLVLWKLEYLLPTSDRIDVVLKDRYGRFVVVEVEVDCSDTELIGPMQCMKYRAMIAYMFQHPIEEVRSMLVAHSIASSVRQQCSRYDIETYIVQR